MRIYNNLLQKYITKIHKYKTKKFRNELFFHILTTGEYYEI